MSPKSAPKVEEGQVWEHRTHGHYVQVLFVLDGDRANIATVDVHGGTVIGMRGRRTVTTRNLRRTYRLPDRLGTTW